MFQYAQSLWYLLKSLKAQQKRTEGLQGSSGSEFLELKVYENHMKGFTIFFRFMKQFTNQKCVPNNKFVKEGSKSAIWECQARVSRLRKH